MNDTESIIREGMARAKIKNWLELSKRTGIVRQTIAYRLKHPVTFNASEIKTLAKLFNWSDADLGRFFRSF